MYSIMYMYMYTYMYIYMYMYIHIHVHVHIVCILLLATQYSAGKRRFLNKPCKTEVTEPTEGLCTNCNTNK